MLLNTLLLKRAKTEPETGRNKSEAADNARAFVYIYLCKNMWSAAVKFMSQQRTAIICRAEPGGRCSIRSETVCKNA